MHIHFEKADQLSKQVIGAAIEVHRLKGPGLPEEIYQKCMMRELELRSIPAESQVIVPVEYKGLIFDQPLRLDIYVGQCLIIELKAVEAILPVHKAQLLSYMKLMNAPLGLLINFHEIMLKRGIRRMLLPGANIEKIDF